MFTLKSRLHSTGSLNEKQSWTTTAHMLLNKIIEIEATGRNRMNKEECNKILAILDWKLAENSTIS